MGSGRHRHRDVFIPLAAAMLSLSGGAPVALYVAQKVNSASGIDLWPNPIIAACAVGFLLGLYLFLALIFSWPLPGGREEASASVTAADTDQEVGRECLLLAQSMWDLLATAQRDAPGAAVETIPETPDSEAIHKAWQDSVRASRIHENKTMSQFLERFGIRLSGVLQVLTSRGYITENEARALWWKTQTTHWLPQIPQRLAAIGRQLGARVP